MLLRPIDAIFVHPERRLYVVYYRGELWQLPRMKIDMPAWERRQPYTGAKEALHLSQNQTINDPQLAQKLHTLDLPIAIRGSTLPRFERWWEVNGYEWLKERLDNDSSPLAAPTPKPAPIPTATQSTTDNVENHAKSHIENTTKNTATPKPVDTKDNANNTDDVFADMLAELADDVASKRN